MLIVIYLSLNCIIYQIIMSNLFINKVNDKSSHKSFSKLSIKNLDLISDEVGFELNDFKRYKTYLGAFVTVIITIFSLVIAILQGQEIYLRKNPDISISSDYQDYSTVYMDETPFFFVISDTYGYELKDINRYLDIQFYLINRTNSIIDYYGPMYGSASRCKNSNFDKFTGVMTESTIDSFLSVSSMCFDYDHEAVIKNGYTYTNSSFVSISFGICNRYSPGSNCADDLEEKITELYISTYFLNSYADTIDYEGPIKYYLDVLTQQVSYGFLKRMYVRMTRNAFESENGWLLQNKVKYSFSLLKDIQLDVNSISSSSPLDIFWITLESPQLNKSYYRKYTKIQDIFASIGGLINALIISKLSFYDYLRFRYQVDLVSSLIEDNEKSNLKDNNIKQINKENFISIKNNLQNPDISINKFKNNDCSCSNMLQLSNNSQAKINSSDWINNNCVGNKNTNLQNVYLDQMKCK